MHHVVKNRMGEFFRGSGWSGRWVTDINEARVFARVQDAKNSFPVLTGRSGAVAVPVTITVVE